jgi:hypothetical protein
MEAGSSDAKSLHPTNEAAQMLAELVFAYRDDLSLLRDVVKWQWIDRILELATAARKSGGDDGTAKRER